MKTSDGAGASARNVVVLDVDDTLYLERHYAASGFHAVADWIEREMGQCGFAETALQLFESGERTNIFDAVLPKMGISVTPKLIERLVRVYREHEPSIELAPDAKRFLARARPGRALAVISDGFLSAQRAKVRALRIDAGTCAPIILTDALGRDCWKPHPRAFLDIQKYFDLPSKCFMYIADNPTKDFIAPFDLGWKTVRIKRDGGLHSDLRCKQAVDMEIESFDQLSDRVLDHIFRA
jgi:putative hydrolase of the HAD superfamily